MQTIRATDPLGLALVTLMLVKIDVSVWSQTHRQSSSGWPVKANMNRGATSRGTGLHLWDVERIARRHSELSGRVRLQVQN